jgi:hypothetical protein
MKRKSMREASLRFKKNENKFFAKRKVHNSPNCIYQYFWREKEIKARSFASRQNSEFLRHKNLNYILWGKNIYKIAKLRFASKKFFFKLKPEKIFDAKLRFAAAQSYLNFPPKTGLPIAWLNWTLNPRLICILFLSSSHGTLN